MSAYPQISFPIPKEDLPLLFEFYNHNFPNSQWSQKHWDMFSPSNTNFVLLGLKTENKYIGLALGEINKENTTLLTISAIAIDSAFRRFGYGTFLLKKLIKITFTQTSAKKLFYISETQTKQNY